MIKMFKFNYHKTLTIIKPNDVEWSGEEGRESKWEEGLLLKGRVPFWILISFWNDRLLKAFISTFISTWSSTRDKNSTTAPNSLSAHKVILRIDKAL